ncbi:MAG: DUF4197 domain-containing protein [Cellvibrio sp.]|uniref:DUF4197 domain-containing protein n=1 Tax=Cellvibrio sp. TaxID=1965322 RepID=UPI0031B295B3
MKSTKKFLISSCLLALPLSLVACNATLPQIAETGANVAGAAGYNNQAQLVRGIKEALELGSNRAATSLSATGGYANNPLYRIALPDNVQSLAGKLRQLGLGGQLDKVEALMNQGAEKAAVEAKSVFVDAVRNMSVTDALGIIRGGNTAATDYFRIQTEASLRQRYLPIIQQNLQQIGFYNQYQQLLSTYKMLPIANKPDLDLEQHVLNQALNGLFKQVAVEEQLIRKDPVGRGSQIIGAVFAQK